MFESEADKAQAAHGMIEIACLRAPDEAVANFRTVEVASQTVVAAVEAEAEATR